MIPKVFTFLFLIFLLNRTQAAPYYYQSIGADFYKPEDKIFYSLIKPTWIWGGLLRDAQFAYAKKLAGPFPEPQLSAEELSWQAEARDWISSWMNFQGGREALEIHLVQIMDSPQTSTRLRSLAEHFFLSQSNGWIETYNNFNDFGSIKKHLLRAIFLKTLLYGSGKTDTEKLALIDNLLQKINTFHSEMDKGQIGRHLRLATEK